MKTTSFVCIATLTAAALHSHAGEPIAWASPTGGVWHNASNWNPASIPGISHDVILGLMDAYTVTIATQDVTVPSVTLANPSASLHVDPSRILTITDFMVNNGTIVINPAGTVTNTSFRITDNASLTGTGRMKLNAPSTRAQIISGLINATLTQSSGHTIHGQGLISAALVSNGLVSADVAGATLVLSTTPKANNARMEAVNGGNLLIQSSTVTQTNEAVIVAEGSGSTVSLSNAIIDGGTLRSVDGGAVVTTASSIIRNLNLDGDFRLTASHALEADGSIHNTGLLLVNPTGAVSSTSLRIIDGTVFTGVGTIRLNAANTRAQIIPATPGATLTQSPDHSIRGEGTITSSLINNGLVSADIASGMMTINGNTTNNAVMEAINAGTLRLQGQTVTQAADAMIRADNAGSVVQLANATVIGGNIGSSDGGSISVLGGNGRLSDLALSGVSQIFASQTLDVDGIIHHTGQMTVNPAAAVATTILRIADGTSFVGDGTVRLNGFGNRAQIGVATTGATLTQSAGHAIRGEGTISAALISNGLVSADVAGATLVLSTTPKANNARMEAVNGGNLLIQSSTVTQTNEAVIVAEGSGSTVSLSNAIIDGGTLRSTDGGSIVTTASSTIRNLNLDGDFRLTASHALEADGSIHNTGLLLVNPTGAVNSTSLRIIDGTVFTGVGTIRLNAASNRAQIIPATFGATLALSHGQRLDGIGSINAHLNHEGTLAPGLSLGTMLATQPVALASSSTFEAEVAGTSNADLFSSTSSFHAAGTLSVVFIDEFNPPLTWNATIVNASQGVTGAFSIVDAPQPTHPRLEFRVIYTPTQIRIGAFCKADANSDGLLNFFDISQFITSYNAGDLSADIAAPFGILNFFDIAEFMARYNTGCP